MSTTTKKFREFMAEPLGDKTIKEVPGIGEVLGTKLTEAGYERAYVLFGKFLLSNKDAELFQDWLQTQCGANAHQAKTTTQALSEWAEAFI
ncbi:unnamed protein product [Didymodactylos carnosus]|uniref:Barrier-to-autointegration factor-like protein n=1 Tax=Didymodactylos carnosus TaxID=1234261 RepID=A0A813XCD5_9BILA|nr:unnamed protein product [Didymodactylos carnosus]CAF0862812.1 unnamed protein product [Didymodactylos carnosus]CAF3593708.1 unnamed protein product [Didymodactylos carnosus]CAF3650427.1 unnamed protein product [Didymodactylos carnosus]